MSNNLDGSKEHLVNIRGLEDYRIPKPESEFRFVSDDSDSDEYQGETHSDHSTSDDSTTDEDTD